MTKTAGMQLSPDLTRRLAVTDAQIITIEIYNKQKGQCWGLIPTSRVPLKCGHALPVPRESRACHLQDRCGNARVPSVLFRTYRLLGTPVTHGSLASKRRRTYRKQERDARATAQMLEQSVEEGRKPTKRSLRMVDANRVDDSERRGSPTFLPHDRRGYRTGKSINFEPRNPIPRSAGLLLPRSGVAAGMLGISSD